MTTPKPLHVACPSCGKKTLWSEENRWRPFCSERCRLIDLGEWFSDNRRIAGEELPPGEDDGSDDGSGER